MFQGVTNSTGIVSDFIKHIVSTTELPINNTWGNYRPLIKDFVYITKSYIVKAKKDFNFEELMAGKDYTFVESFKKSMNINNKEYFEILSPYVFNKHYPNITSTFVSNKSSYDSDTHYYLGQYLRMLRDLCDVDLMSLYNCWGGLSTDSYRFKKVNNKFKLVENKTLDNDVMLIVPIKFNQEYTIYLNSFNQCYMSFGYYINGSIEYKNNGPVTSSTATIVNLNKSNCSYIKPYVFKGVTAKSEGQDISNFVEKELVLLLQIPRSCIETTVILEGDYSKNKIVLTDYSLVKNNISTKIFSPSLPEIVNKNTIGVTSVASLTRTFGDASYILGDSLIEYLLLNAITPIDDISDNIKRVQTFISSNKFVQENGLNYFFKSDGIWTDSLKEAIYKSITTNKKKSVLVDELGYVDKYVEEMLLRGKE